LEKSPDAFRTISEVAEEVNVPQHVLRFWESRFAQIRPLKRGGGRRYYRPDDVDLLRGVRHLLYGEGYTIRGVQRILREEGISFVQNVWRAGAQQPPPEAQEDGVEERDGAERDGAESAAAGPDEPSFFGLLPAAAREADEAADARREPAMTPAVAAPRRRISDADRHQLQAALDELVTCRRLIDAALADAPADDN
jgi:DNA-binding transcriptional MerR regulator